MNQEQLRNLDTIVNTYGNDPQTDMAIEECSELIKALLKYRRKRYNADTAGEKELRAAIIDEIADVQIMIAQLQIMHDCIETVDGKEVYHKARDTALPAEIEHIYPDYSIYPQFTEDTAYGFLTRGCPRGCEFCHVAEKEGRCSCKVAELEEFWRGQKNIMLCDPNIIACPDWKELLQQLIDSKAKVNINQGIDIRIMTDAKAEMIKQLRVDSVHFAWDRYEDKDIIIPKLKMFKEITGWKERKTSVYVLTNYNTTHEQDLERIYTLRDLNYDPYVMIYDKQNTRGNDPVRLLQRYVNNRKIFKTIKRFEDYDPKMG